MRFDVATLFPELITQVCGESVIGRAQAAGYITVAAHNIRDYSADRRHRVDDTPYGGGFGMLMAVQPVYDCITAVAAMTDIPRERTRVIYLSPKGRVLDHDIALELSGYERLILLCGHYEGIDQRVLDETVDEELSIGDYVLTGGELPACVLIDCVSRLCAGVLPSSECYEKESVASGLLEYPQYTRPPLWHGMAVPEVLLSGDHARVDRWREERSRELTKEKRPDLLK